MKKIILPILIILTTIAALAADVPRERIITTTINISGTSWIDDQTNNSQMNITILTEDKGSNYQINIGPAKEFGPNQYTIMFTQWLSCEDILENQLLNQTLDMFTSCNGNNCKAEYENCNTSKGTIEQNKGQVDTELAACTTTKNSCTTNLTEKTDQASTIPSLKTNLKKCTEDLTIANNRWYLYLLGGGGAGALLFWIAKREKKTRSPEEKRAGPREYARQPWDDEKKPWEE